MPATAAGTATRSPRGRAVDRCGRPRARPALAEILEHVHQVEALALLASMPATIGRGHGDTFTTRPGCRSVWTAAGTAGDGGDPGTRPPGRGPRFAGQHAGDDRPRTATRSPPAGLSIGVDGRGHRPAGRRSWNTSTRSRPSLRWPACRRRSAAGTADVHHRPGCRSVRTAAGTAAAEILEHVHRVEALALHTARPGCRSAAGTATRSPPAGLSIGVDGRGHGRHGGRSWNTSTRSRPSLCWPACRRRSATGTATRSPPAGLSIGVDGRGHGRVAEILEHVHRVEALACHHAGRAVDRPRARRHVHHRPGCRSVWTAAGRPAWWRSWNTSTRSRPSLCWPACRRRPRARRHVHHATGLSIGVDGRGHGRSWRRSWNTSTCSLRRRCSPRGRVSIGVDQGRAVDRPRARPALAEILEHVHGSRPSLCTPHGRAVDRPRARRHVHHRPGCRSVWTAAGAAALVEILEHVHRVEALALLASMPATAAGTAAAGGDPGTRPPGRGPRFAGQHAGDGRGHGDTFTTGRAVDRCGRPRARPALVEILEHVHRVEALALRTTRPGCRSAAGTATRSPPAGLSIGPDGRGYRRHWWRSWNTSTRLGPRFAHHAGRAVDRSGRPRARPEILEHVHQVEALALLTTRPGCRSVRTAASTAGAGGDPGTRPPGRGPRFAQPARPGCRSVRTAAGTAGAGGDPGTRPPGRGPCFAHHTAGLSIGRGHGDTFTTGRAVDRSGRPRVPSALVEILEHVHQVRPSLCAPHGRAVDRSGRPRARPALVEILEHVHQVEALALLTTRPGSRSVRTAAGTAGAWWRSWNTSTGSRPSLLRTTRAGLSIGVDGRGHGRLVEILEHVHQVEALASLTTRPGCRSVWTVAGTIGTGGDPGTRPPGRGPRFAGQHAGADRRHVHHGPGLSIGVDGRGHGRRSWNTSTRLGPRLAHHAAGLSIGRGHGDTFTTGRAVDRSRTAAGTVGTGGDPRTRPPG